MKPSAFDLARAQGLGMDASLAFANYMTNAGADAPMMRELAELWAAAWRGGWDAGFSWTGKRESCGATDELRRMGLRDVLAKDGAR